MTRKDEKLKRHFGDHRKQGKHAVEAIDRHRLAINPICSVALEAWGRAHGYAAFRTKLWDYLLVSPSDRLLGVEVHPATAGDVKDVMEKQGWALARLKEAQLVADQWWWVPSGKNTIPSSGRSTRLLAKAGILLSRRVLDEQQIADADR